MRGGSKALAGCFYSHLMGGSNVCCGYLEEVRANKYCYEGLTFLMFCINYLKRRIIESCRIL